MSDDEAAATELKNTFHRWEQTGKSWEGISTNNEGHLVWEYGDSSQFQSETEKKKNELVGKQRGLIRSLALVIDVTEEALAPRQFGQSRIVILVKSLNKFISSFFDENPLSMMTIIATYNYRATVLSPLSRNIKEHLNIINTLSDINAIGEPSIYNSILVSTSLLRSSVPCSTKEILFIYGSFKTCDPKPVQDTLNLLKQNPPCVASCIGFDAKFDFMKRITEENHGKYFIPSSNEHLFDILSSFVQPPGWIEKTQKMQFLPFGFPKTITDTPAFDVSKIYHERKEDIMPELTNIACPQCGTKVFDLPCFCPCCSHLLFSAGHLTRAKHHLRPINSFKPTKYIKSDNGNLKCFGCNIILSQEDSSEHPNIYQCKDCGSFFCNDCNKFIHESLQNCPGCLSLNLSKNII